MSKAQLRSIFERFGVGVVALVLFPRLLFIPLAARESSIALLETFNVPRCAGAALALLRVVKCACEPRGRPRGDNGDKKKKKVF